MRYSKPALTYEQQADLLIARGMSGDRDRMISRLQTTSYYRLSGYWHPYRKDENGKLLPNDEFRPGSTFDDVGE
jgi:abortive infection bacteriophage resistance protein